MSLNVVVPPAVLSLLASDAAFLKGLETTVVEAISLSSPGQLLYVPSIDQKPSDLPKVNQQGETALMANHVPQEHGALSVKEAAALIAAALNLPITPQPGPPNMPSPVVESVHPVASTQGKASIKIGHPDGSETTSEELIDKPKLFAGPVCEVSVTAGLTLALAQKFEFARLDVGVKIPCAHTELDQVFDYAKSWVDAKMSKLAAEVHASKNQN